MMSNDVQSNNIDPNTTLTKEQINSQKKGRFAITGFVFSLIGMLLIPIIPSIIGIVFSVKGMNSKNHGFAVAGLVIGIISLFIVLIVAPIIISIAMTSLRSARDVAQIAAFQADTHASMTDFMFACENDTLTQDLIQSRASFYIEWSAAILEENNCSEDGTDFTITNIIPLQTTADCHVSIIHGELDIVCK